MGGKPLIAQRTERLDNVSVVSKKDGDDQGACDSDTRPLMNPFLPAFYFFLCAFDAWITRKRILSYGPQVEGNEIVRNLATTKGPEVAAYVGIILPSILITLVLVALDWPLVLAGLTGYRIRMFINQFQSLQFEKEARRIKNTINQSSGRDEHPPSS